MSIAPAGGATPDTSSRVNCSMEPPLLTSAHEPIVDVETIYSLADAAALAGLAKPEMRDALMVGVDPFVVASIRLHSSPRIQTFQDLVVLAQHPRHLWWWLRTAIFILLPGAPHRSTFEKVLRGLPPLDQLPRPPPDG